MYQGCKIGLVLLMGGSGERCGGAVPKQFALIQNIPIYLHTLKPFRKSALFDQIVLVSHPKWVEKVRAFSPDLIVVEGGKTRQESSFLGLKGFSDPPDIVMMHDAVRPFVSEKIILDNLAGAIAHGAVDTCVASPDTIVHSPCGKKIHTIPKRKEFLRGQTPQTFRFAWLVQAHEAALREQVTDVSDDCQLVLRSGRSVHVVDGCERNFKITTEFDLIMSNHIISS